MNGKNFSNDDEKPAHHTPIIYNLRQSDFMSNQLKKRENGIDSRRVLTSHDIFFHHTPKSTKGYNRSNVLNLTNCGRNWNRTLFQLKNL